MIQQTEQRENKQKKVIKSQFVIANKSNVSNYNNRMKVSHLSQQKNSNKHQKPIVLLNQINKNTHLKCSKNKHQQQQKKKQLNKDQRALSNTKLKMNKNKISNNQKQSLKKRKKGGRAWLMKIKKEAILVCSISSLSPQTKTKLIDKKKRKTNISNTINLPSITIVILKCSRFRTAQLITATSAGIGRTLSNAPVLSVTASSNQKHMMVRSTERTSLRL